MPYDEPFTTGSTPSFRLVAKRDGEVWDITGATVMLYLTDPAGTEAEYSATLTTPTSGIADYQVATSVLNAVGTWYRQWQVTQSGVVMWSKKRPFHVEQGG